MKLDHILGWVDLVFILQLWLKMVSTSTRLHLEWLKFAEMPPSRGRDATLQSPASQENNGATGGAQPCSEMWPAPHCLRGKVRKPSLEFKLLHNPPRLAYPALSRLRPPAPARPSSSLNLLQPLTMASPVFQTTISPPASKPALPYRKPSWSIMGPTTITCLPTNSYRVMFFSTLHTCFFGCLS